MASAVHVSNYESKSSLPAVVDFKQQWLTPSLAIYNGPIYLQLASVTFVATLDEDWRSLTDSEAVFRIILSYTKGMIGILKPEL